MPGERAEDEEVAVPEAEGVSGTTRVLLPGHLDPLVRAEAADDKEEESDDNDGDEQEDPEICKHIHIHRRVRVTRFETSSKLMRVMITFGCTPRPLTMLCGFCTFLVDVRV